MESFTSFDDARNKVDSFVSQNQEFSYLKKYTDIFIETTKVEERIGLLNKYLGENKIDEAMRIINT